MDPEMKAGLDQMKAHLDVLAQALDRVATDPEIRKRMETQPIETLTELGFELDEKDRAEILEDLIVARTSQTAFPSVKSITKSGVKIGVQTGVSIGIKTIVKLEPGQE